MWSCTAKSWYGEDIITVLHKWRVLFIGFRRTYRLGNVVHETGKKDRDTIGYYGNDVSNNAFSG